MSSRRKIYKDYFADLSPRRAGRVLLFFAAGLLAAEGAARVSDPQYERTALSSLHGVRAIFQQAMEDPRPKILAFGDSTLVGGGIYTHNQTVLGRMSQAINGPRVYNLAVPGGDTSSTVLLLDAVRQQQMPRVDRVIIEVLASKFTVSKAGGVAPKTNAEASWDELQHLIPDLRPALYDLPLKRLSRSERVETWTQWQLGRISKLYRHRDYFRTEISGNYPIFWLTAKILPRSVLARLYPAKAHGINRLAARVSDYDFDPAAAEPVAGTGSYFAPHDQGDYLLKAIALAKQVSAQPPLILAHPMHYNYSRLTPVQRATTRHALQQFERYLREVAREYRCELVIVSSENFQNPADWTATAAHFNARGAEKVWKILRPEICGLYSCKTQ